MVAKESKIIQEAAGSLYELSEEEKIQMQCEAREMYRMDMSCARNEGIAYGIKLGREEGEVYRLVKLVCKKLRKNCSVGEIADMLEEDEEIIRVICEAASSFAPDYDVELIVEGLQKVKSGIL